MAAAKSQTQPVRPCAYCRTLENWGLERLSQLDEELYETHLWIAHGMEI